MLENIRLSFEGIWSHKMRSFLTMLGVIIGIASIISIVSTIKGTSEQLKNQVIGAGNNLVQITLYNGDTEYDPEYSTSKDAPILTKDQKNRIRKLKDVDSASFYHGRSYADGIYHNNNSMSGGRIYGIDMEYLDTARYKITAGRAFVEQDYTDYRKVVLLDESAAKALFDTDDPLGQTVEIREEAFIVVGIVEQETQEIRIETYEDYQTYTETSVGCVFIPGACWPIVYHYDEPENVVIKAREIDAMSRVGKDAAEILNEGLSSAGSGLLNAAEDTMGEDSDLSSMGTSEVMRYKADDLLQRARNLQNLSEGTSVQLLWIASISLLVGGIGVMNIMLVSVTERTREIGLKKAIGARKNTILLQFLTEAAVLTSIGGLLGVAAGIVLAQVIHRISDTPVAISIPAIVGSVLFSTLIGLIFGFLPSVKAANLNPIDALRSE